MQVARISGLLLILLLKIIFLQGEILTVIQNGTGDFENIQQAIDNSENGDTILVYPGTYYENIHFNDKEIVVASLYLLEQDESYIHSTIIDGNSNGSCVVVNAGYNDVRSLIGFTVQNGKGDEDFNAGGGILIESSSISISNCVIKGNNAYAGGGIFGIFNSYINLSQSSIINNWAVAAGGGIQLGLNSEIIFDSVNRCNIYMNHAARGCDVSVSTSCQPISFYADTFTVLNPDNYFIIYYDENGFPTEGMEINILNQFLEPVNSDLFVDPVNGSDVNQGTSPDYPLKTISFAYKKILPDTLDPKSIYLANGTYSHEMNGERFPVNLRGYTQLIGESKEGTILDAEYDSYLMQGNNLTHNYLISNLSMINGNGNLGETSTFGCCYFKENSNVTIQSIKVENCTSSLGSGLYFSDCSFNLENSEVISNSGSFAVSAGNYSDITRTFSISNLTICNNGPDEDPQKGHGGGIRISGRLSVPESYHGKISNIRVTDNYRESDPFFGEPNGTGMMVLNNAVVTLINSTFSNNLTDTGTGSGILVSDGAILNVYNSILYGNSGYEIALGSSSGQTFSSTVEISYSNILGGESGIKNWNGSNTVIWNEGNINEEPSWLESPDNSYQLSWDSPCLNSGTPNFEQGLEPPYIIADEDQLFLVTQDNFDTISIPNFDLMGNPRVFNSRIDMGCFEFTDTSVNISSSNQGIIALEIYPNPVHDGLITFRYPKTDNHRIVELRCFNLYGGEIYYEKINQFQERSIVESNAWSNGIYFAIIYSENGPVDMTKFIIR